MKDLENYKRYNFIPSIGFESGSHKLLCDIGKVFGQNRSQVEKRALSFLNKMEKIIEKSNEIELPVQFYYMIGVPGTDAKSINENRLFLFEPRYEGKSLIQKYKVNLLLWKYSLLFGNTIYKKGEKMFGAKYYFKEWWKLFDENQSLYSAIVNPSSKLSFPELMESTIEDVRKIFKEQKKLNNPYYSTLKWIEFYSFCKKLLLIYSGSTK